MQLKVSSHILSVGHVHIKKKSPFIHVFCYVFNKAGLLYLWTYTAHHIQCRWAILTTTAQGIVSDQPSQCSQRRRERLYSEEEALPAFQESACFSKWKYKSKDPERERSSQQTFSLAVNGVIQHHGQSKRKTETNRKRCRELDNLDFHVTSTDTLPPLSV